MTLTLSIPALAALVGLLLWTLTSGKLAEIGRLLFHAALVALLLHVSRL